MIRRAIVRALVTSCMVLDRVPWLPWPLTKLRCPRGMGLWSGLLDQRWGTGVWQDVQHEPERDEDTSFATGTSEEVTLPRTAVVALLDVYSTWWTRVELSPERQDKRYTISRADLTAMEAACIAVQSHRAVINRALSCNRLPPRALAAVGLACVVLGLLLWGVWQVAWAG